MSAEDEEQVGTTSLPGGDHQETVPRTIAADAMFTVRRIEVPGSAEGGTQLTSREVNALRWLAIEQNFMAEGWPQFDALVAVSPNDYCAWGAMPDDWRDALAAEGTHPQAEVVGKFERGLQFIRRRVEPLTPEYWLAEEAQLIRQARGTLDRGAAFDAGYELGVLRTRAYLHGLHLGSVAEVRTRNVRLRDAGVVGTKNLRKGAAPWRRRALELAQDLRVRRPELKASPAAGLISKTLNREGHTSGRGNAPPGVQAIRKVIAPLFRDGA